jgi:hypothetical protein
LRAPSVQIWWRSSLKSNNQSPRHQTIPPTNNFPAIGTKRNAPLRVARPTRARTSLGHTTGIIVTVTTATHGTPRETAVWTAAWMSMLEQALEEVLLVVIATMSLSVGTIVITITRTRGTEVATRGIGGITTRPDLLCYDETTRLEMKI